MVANDKKYKILIIEDEALVARELKGRLNNMGYEVVGIAYGAEGTELARNTNPDLLLTDIHLKDGQDGIALAQAIQRERDVPVVFLTAYTDEETVTRAKSVTPYGYIIKPVENRELQITIEMALYKFNIEIELRETQQLLQTALTCIGSALIFVDRDGSVTDINADAEQLFAIGRSAVVGVSWLEVFALEADAPVGRKLSFALQSGEVTKLAPFIVSRSDSKAHLVDGIVGPMEGGAVIIVRKLSEIHDPVEMLATPRDMLATLGSENLSPSESSMCQLLIGVDQTGGQTGPIMEIVSQLLNQMLRATDLVSRFGGSQLSVSMPYTAVTEGWQIAQSLLKSLSEMDGVEGLTFSIGLSYTTPGDQQPFELFRRANWALNVARESGGHRVIQWNENSENPQTGRVNESTRQREYHNLVLLWNVMNVVVKADSKEESSAQLAKHILQSFEFEKVAVLENEGDAVVALGGVVAGAPTFDLRVLGLTEADLESFRSLTTGTASYLHRADRYLFPLADDKALFIGSARTLEQSEIDFLQTLASYFAAGFSRQELEPDKSVNGEDGELLFQSPRMRSILDSVKLVAPTDATVLIIGESGTGKEMLARSIHTASNRADKPFVIVDCGSVVGSLIESELFGHVKGAFTGADRHATGRLKEASGGTVLLDEVGELPLDVQVKLLRFVQEQEIAAVGSNRHEKVDARVIAATNRNLQALVQDGLFREDLFYRLNVFTIETPPLRERDGDGILLARHFLDRYARQYGKRINGFTAGAERALMEHAWPGNIRELMNLINRAVILCRDSRVSNIHLGLFPDASTRAGELATESVLTLEDWLGQLVDTCLDADPLPPVGLWLEEDLVLATLSTSDNVLNRAARSLGIPESTLRRKVGRFRIADATRTRPGYGEPLLRMMPELTRSSLARDQTILEVLSGALLKELEARHLNRRVAAGLMGVSLPTYRKMSNETP